MYHSRKQHGQSSGGALFTIVMMLFLGITVMKLWGAYYGDYSVGKVVESLGADRSLASKSPKEINEMLMRRLEINSVAIDPKDVKITTDGRGTHLAINYERRVPLFGNLDGVARFSHSVTIEGAPR